ncbi:MAG: hypothetical protein HY909_21820 [Deltaproteobacteria bacterium]|nr:hypothetical protein [Deltaproteobacteria bacterium]
MSARAYAALALACAHLGCARTAPVRLGACAVERSLLPDTAGEEPLGVRLQGDALWTLLGRQTARGVAVRLRREGPRGAVLFTTEAPRWDAVSSLVELPGGAAFAVGRPGHLTAWKTDGRAVREFPFPRGELPRGRAAHIPAVHLAAERGGALSALLRFPQPYGVVRVHTQDVGEAPLRTPLRPDRWSHAAMALVGDQAVVVQRRERRAFFGDATLGAGLELATTPTSPWSTAPLAVTPFGENGEAPQVAALGDGPTAGVAIVWRTVREVLYAFAPRAPEGTAWTVGAARALPLPPGTLALAPLGATCGAVAVSLDDKVHLSPLDASRGRHGAVVTWDPGPDPEGVQVVRGGDRTWLATRSASGVRVAEVVPDARCGLSLREVALPGGLRARARMAGFAGDETHAVLALTDQRPDAAETTLEFVTLDARGEALLAPPREACRQGVTAISLLGSVVVAAGRGPPGLLLRRMNDPDEERYDDLLLRASVGEEVTLVASASRRRVWVTDRSDGRPSPFGPPRAVVLYSAIDTLEDGPRTEVRTAVPYSAEFHRTTLADTLEGPEPRWAMTWSRSTDEPCIPGTWAALTDANDAPVALRGADGPWAHARALRPEATCEDRVAAAAWRGTRVTALLATGRGGLVLSSLELQSGAPREHALQAAGAPLANEGMALGDRGGLALWQRQGEGSLHLAGLRAEGVPSGDRAALALQATGQRHHRPLPVDTDGRDAAALVPTDRGVVVVRVRCDAAR